MARVKTGDSTDYSTADEDEAQAAAEAAFDVYDDEWDDDNPSRMFIRAEIEWAGTFNPQAHRATQLRGLNLGPVRDAVRAARPLMAKVRTAGAGLTARGWHAQIRELTRTAKGYEAADRAGLNVTRPTLLGWLSQEGTPSAANQRRIASAYGMLREDRIASARKAARGAAHRTAEALNEAMRRPPYNAEVRFRDITEMIIEP